jgi:hypothetical protein
MEKHKMQRRTFLEIGSSLAAMPFFIGAAPRNNPHAPFKKTKLSGEKAVVFVILGGGISHIDFTHSRPDLLNGMHSINGAIETKTPGLWLGGDFTKMAGITDKLNIVHNYHHKTGNHANGVMWQMSGKLSVGDLQQEPAYGTFISKIYGPSNETNGIPLYLKTSRIEGEEGAWLGSAYNPYDANGKNTGDLVLKLEPGRFAQRLKMLAAVDKNGGLLHSQTETMNKLRNQAVNMIAGDLKKAFEIEHESPEVREAYGKNGAGDSFVLARRLIENGGRFITIRTGSWDHHQNISDSMKGQVPAFDKAYTAFIQDLEQRGMLENTLVVVTSDFGRTVRINKDAGRDHHSALCSLVFAGGTSQKGRVIGKADKNMFGHDDNGSMPYDVAKTIFDHFGVSNTQFTDSMGRPRWMYEKEAVNLLV